MCVFVFEGGGFKSVRKTAEMPESLGVFVQLGSPSCYH